MYYMYFLIYIILMQILPFEKRLRPDHGDGSKWEYMILRVEFSKK